jgi:putative SOS response-associated peptidase YedK
MHGSVPDRLVPMDGARYAARMCSRYANSKAPEQIARLFRTVNPLFNLEPNWNIGPRQRAPIVRRHPQSGERHLDALEWGLAPHFTKDLKTARRPHNVRAETSATAPMFRNALAKRQALVPMDAFYEWQETDGVKQPHAASRRDGQPLVLAGIWESWRAPDGEILRTFGVITSAPNREMTAIHERMPVVLEPSEWPLWLGEIEGDHEGLMRAAPDRTLDIWPVDRAVGNIRGQGPQLLDRVQITPPM